MLVVGVGDCFSLGSPGCLPFALAKSSKQFGVGGGSERICNSEGNVAGKAVGSVKYCRSFSWRYFVYSFSYHTFHSHYLKHLLRRL